MTLDIGSRSTIGDGLTKYEPSLDGMRAFAVLFVVLFHASPARFPGGWIGVDVFFVLSGFLITSLIKQEIILTGNFGFKKFYYRRILRLAPAFVLLLLTATLLAAVLPDRSDNKNIVSIIVSALYMMNINRAFSIFPPGYLGHTWSLAMEEQFYIVWPVAFILIFHRQPLRWISVFIVVITTWRVYLALAGADPDRIYNGFDTHSDALLIGCGLSLLPIRNSFQVKMKEYSSIPIIILMIIAVKFNERTFFTQIAGLSLAALASAWLVVAVLQQGFLKRFLSHKIFVFTGRISYGWYLWHYFIYSVGKSNLPLFPGITYLLVFSAYPVAVISFLFVERPFLKLKARVEPTMERYKQQIQSTK